jgi:hypothetical protein
MNIHIEHPNGEKKEIEIGQFPALDGWDIQARFVEFAASHDKDFRRAYTLEVLSYSAVVIASNNSIALKTSQVIDNHLGGWQNVERVFEETLIQNGIDPKTHADRPVFWEKAGAEMATAFLAEVTRLFGPAIEIATSKAS